MDSDEKLRIKEVSPLKIERDRVLIQSGIEEGAQVVITTISGAADGMKLRTIQ
jgi:hypothetical protein